MKQLNLRIPSVTAIVLAAHVSGCASLVTPNFTQDFTQLRSGAYTLDPEHAFLIFRIEHLGLSTVVGRFNSVDATLDFDPEMPEELILEGQIDVASIDLNSSDFEQRLRGSDWLGTEKFPSAGFVSTSVVPQGDNAMIINGDFTLRGISKPVSLLATFKGGADNVLTGRYTLGFAASGSISRSDFGVDAFKALVADEVFIELHAEFQQVAL